MQILGIVGYVLLCVLAIIWLAGVRTELGCGVHVILSSLSFVVSALVIPMAGLSMLHSWWMIPAGYAVAAVAAACFEIPAIWMMLRVIAGLYAGLIRIGIPRSRIRAAQAAANWAIVEEWAGRKAGAPHKGVPE